MRGAQWRAAGLRLPAGRCSCRNSPSRRPAQQLQRRGLATEKLSALPGHLNGRVGDSAVEDSVAWLEQRFESHHAPSRADLITVVGQVDGADQLDGVFRVLRHYRQWNIPLQQDVSAALTDACLRADKPELAAHALAFHSEMRVWPGSEEYTKVIQALLAAADVDGALSLLRSGLGAPTVEVDDAAVDAVLGALINGDEEPAAEEAVAEEAAAVEEAASEGEEETAASPALPRVALMRRVEKLLLLAQTAGNKPSAGSIEQCAEAMAAAGQTYRAERVRELMWASS